MESVEDGAEPLSIDVNDNQDTCKSRLSFPDCEVAPCVDNNAEVVLCGAGTFNGFPEHQEVDGGRRRGGGGERTDVTADRMSCRVKEPRIFNTPAGDNPHPQMPFAINSASDMKIPNGDVAHEASMENQSPGLTTMGSSLERGVKVGNGGLLIVNSYDSLSQVPFAALAGHPELESHLVPESDRFKSSGGRVSPASTRSSPVDACAKLSLSPLVENTSDYTETDPSPEEDLAGPPPRPQSLRTNAGHVSLSCDATPLSPGDDGYFGIDGVGDECPGSLNTFEVGRRQSAPDGLVQRFAVDADASSDQCVGTKRHGIAEFLTRSLFSWKPRESQAVGSPSALGWKLFGKIPLRENLSKDSRTIQQEYEYRTGPLTEPPLPALPMRRKNLEFEPLSTTALILEDRPANLPAKSEEESQRHRQEYSEMVAEAKRREVKENQKKKRQMKERHRQEESIANAMVIWNTEVLPNWESMRNSRRVRELWWQGVPPSVRGKVWSLAIGNELNITPELYEIFLSRAKEKWRSFSETSSVNESEDCSVSLADRESSLDLIKLDISRTFPSLFIFQKGGPYHDILHSVLGAYTCYRPDVGYVQGMSFIAAVLILNLEEADAFIAFANLLNKPCQMAFFRVDHDLMLKYFAAFEVFFEENLPRLHQHFQINSLTPDFYLIDWIFTLYSKSLPLDVACRVWDVFCRDGEEALFRTGLGILKLYQEVLLQMDFIHSAQFLSRLPENTPSQALFSCIANTQMISSNRRWNQVFSSLMRDADRSPALRS